MWLLAVHPALTHDLTHWLRARGLKLGWALAVNDEPVWTTTPIDPHDEDPAESMGVTE